MVFYVHSSTMEALQEELFNCRQLLVEREQQILSLERSLFRNEQISSDELSSNPDEVEISTRCNCASFCKVLFWFLLSTMAAVLFLSS